MPSKKSTPRDNSSLRKKVLVNNARQNQKQNILSKIQQINKDISGYLSALDELRKEQHNVQKNLIKSNKELDKITNKHSKLLSGGAKTTRPSRRRT